MWRRVERSLETIPPQSEEAAPLMAEWARLRTEHQRLIKLARAHHRPEPSPWPTPHESDEEQATG